MFSAGLSAAEVADAEVLVGAGILDDLPELAGIDWRQIVRDRADELNLWSATRCVLGMLFEDKSEDTYQESDSWYNFNTGETETETWDEQYGDGYTWFCQTYPDYDMAVIGFCPGETSGDELRAAWLRYLFPEDAS